MEESIIRKPACLTVHYYVLKRFSELTNSHLASVVGYGITSLILKRNPCSAVRHKKEDETDKNKFNIKINSLFKIEIDFMKMQALRLLHTLPATQPLCYATRDLP